MKYKNYAEYKALCVQACVDLMGESVREFFESECSFEEEFYADEDPAQVASDNRDSM